MSSSKTGLFRIVFAVTFKRPVFRFAGFRSSSATIDDKAETRGV
jgi:hypothetical protein